MTPPSTNPSNPTKRIAIAIELDHSVPWHYDCCAGILRYGQAQGWSCSIDPMFMDHARPGAVAGYDGVVGRIGAEVAQAAQAQGIPVVNHWKNSPAKDLPSIALDNRASGQMAGEHLVACGYRSLGYVGVQNDLTTMDYVQGLSQVAAEAGLAPPAVHLSDGGFTLSTSRETFGRFLDELDLWLTGLTTPAGLIVGDVTIARYVAQRCKRLGLSVPGEVGIVVWNGNASATAISPSLSALDNDWFAVGYQAASMLDELMEGKHVHPQHRLITPTRLIVRESTDVFLCEDELVRDAMRYIAEHCQEAVKIDDIAEELLVSRRTLERRFDEVLGKTINDEITRLRIDFIKRVLMDSDLPLATIGHDCGFSNASYFATYFRKATGLTPGQFRKQYRTEEGEHLNGV